MIQTFKKLWEADNELSFHIAGQYQDERYQLYIENLKNKLPFKINFDGWVEDVPGYLADKDFVISTSIFESFQYSLAEGMAQGVVPLCHSWAGSELIYPPEYIFDTPEEAVEIVKTFADADNKDEIRQRLRQHIIDNFSFEKQLEKTKEMLKGLYDEDSSNG